MASSAEAPLGGEYQGNDARCREIDVLEAVAWLIKDMAKFKRDEFKIVEQACVFFHRKRRQNAILLRVVYDYQAGLHMGLRVKHSQGKCPEIGRAHV